MSKTKNAKGKPDASEFFDSMDQGVLLQMIQYYPVQVKALCMLLSLDIQLVLEEQQKENKTKKQIEKSYDNQGKI
tara:strand:- start:489 stop:713 length:225 start_codon:yes stop_codon:yes gene_type:complete